MAARDLEVTAPTKWTAALNEEIKRTRMNVREIADQANIAHTTVRDLIAGAVPDAPTLKALYRALPRMKFYEPALREGTEPAATDAAPASLSATLAERIGRPLVKFDPHAKKRQAQPAPVPTPLPWETPAVEAAEPAPANDAAEAPELALDTPDEAPVSIPPVRTREEVARTFGEALRAAREASGDTHAQVADVLGLTVRAITQWEHGTGIPVRANYARLVELYPALDGQIPDEFMRDGPTTWSKAERENTQKEAAPVQKTIEPKTTSIVDPLALVKFGRTLERASASLDAGTLIPLLESAETAGLSLVQLIDMLRTNA